jgi:Raf kinase inhibitor-like YbhB/YbcL family protein
MVRGGNHRLRSAVAVAILLASSMLLSGCGLLSPQSLSNDAPLNMEVSTPLVHGALPAEFTCYGERKTGSPQTPSIFWSGANTHAAKSFVLIIDDHDAPITPRVYWVVFDIGSDSTDLQVGSLPPGAREARNSTGQPGYDPPCPVGAPHQYRITVYALNTFLGKALPSNPQLLPTWTAIAPHVIGRGTMNVTACPAPGTPTTNPACQKAKSRSAA